MKAITLLILSLSGSVISTDLFAQQERALEEARKAYRALTNGLAECGVKLPNGDAPLQIFGSQKEALRFRAGTDFFEFDLDQSPLRPHLLVRNRASQYELRTFQKVVPDPTPFKLTREQAEAKAKVFAGYLGPQVDDRYRFHPCEWPMSRSHYPDSAKRSWAFAWHRHLGKYPIFSETIETVVDDGTGVFANYHSYVRNEPYALVEHPTPTPEEARKRIEAVIYKGYGLDPTKPEKGYLHHIGGPFLVVASPRLLTQEQIQRLGKTPDGKQRVRLAWAYHFWISPNGKPTEERIKKLNPAEAARSLFDAETFEIIPL